MAQSGTFREPYTKTYQPQAVMSFTCLSTVQRPSVNMTSNSKTRRHKQTTVKPETSQHYHGYIWSIFQTEQQPIYISNKTIFGQRKY